MLKISSPTGIKVKNVHRDHLIIEQGRLTRDWSRLGAASVREINADKGKLFIDAVDLEIPYVTFGPGSYTIETM